MMTQSEISSMFYANTTIELLKKKHLVFRDVLSCEHICYYTFCALFDPARFAPLTVEPEKICLN